MIEITTDELVLYVDETYLQTLQIRSGEEARKTLASIWGADVADLLHYQAIFFDKSLPQLTEADSFVSLSSVQHGYIADIEEKINNSEARKQIEIDLEIINRESQWSAEDSIYFDDWWPAPNVDIDRKTLEFGVSLKDFYQQVFNRTLNRLFLTRYGHFSLNYSLSENAIKQAQPLSYYQEKLDEITVSLSILEGYRYEDVDEDNDIPSRSRLINLILSSEIF